MLIREIVNAFENLLPFSSHEPSSSSRTGGRTLRVQNYAFNYLKLSVNSSPDQKRRVFNHFRLTLIAMESGTDIAL